LGAAAWNDPMTLAARLKIVLFPTRTRFFDAAEAP
jgi:hypothetical protein